MKNRNIASSILSVTIPSVVFVALSVLCIPLMFPGCAETAINKKLDREVKEETTVKSSADLVAEIDDLIQNSPGLTADQRSKLSQLEISTREKTREMKTQSIQLKSVLVKTLLSKEDREAETEALKKRIRKIENSQLDLLFTAVDQAQDILGHHKMQEDHIRIIQAFISGHSE